MSKWPTVRLGEIIVDSCYGTSEPSSAEGTVPVVGIPHIKNGRVRLTNMSHVRLSKPEHAKLALEPGDILITRTNSPELVGRSGIVDCATNAVFASYLVRLRVDASKTDPVYLNCWLKQPAWSATDSTHYDPRCLPGEREPTELKRQLHILLPPLDEQRRIADILATWDSAIEATEQLIRLKRSEILGIAKAAAISREGARTVRIGDICVISKGSGLSKKDLSPTGSRPCILYGDLHTTYREVASQVLSRTDVTKAVQSKSGDVLIPSSSETREDLANATALSQDGVLLGGDINILRPKAQGEYDAEYLAYHLTHAKRKAIASLAQGNSVVHLYGRDIARIEVTLPDAKAQSDIAHTLRMRQRKIELLARLVFQYRCQKAGLMQVLLGTPDRNTP